ncbi:MAG: hypothetical protein K2P30_16780, partial [Lachnospiraceae bacterium]|nr:hypothetical protein [Lachnospiraceae bacterium]
TGISEGSNDAQINLRTRKRPKIDLLEVRCKNRSGTGISEGSNDAQINLRTRKRPKIDLLKVVVRTAAELE